MSLDKAAGDAIGFELVAKSLDCFGDGVERETVRILGVEMVGYFVEGGELGRFI